MSLDGARLIDRPVVSVADYLSVVREVEGELFGPDLLSVEDLGVGLAAAGAFKGLTPFTKKEQFVAAGSTTSIDTGNPALTKAQCLLFIEGVHQSDASYNLVGGVISPVGTWPSGSGSLEVVVRHAPVAGGVAAGASTIVTSISELKQLDPNMTTIAFLHDGGRSGWFEWKTGNYADLVAIDTEDGVIVASDNVASTEGAWVRVNSSVRDPLWFGAVGEALGTAPTVNDTVAIQAWAKMGGLMRLTPDRQFLVDDESVVDLPHKILPSTGQLYVSEDFPAGKAVLRIKHDHIPQLGNFFCGIAGFKIYCENQTDMSTEGDGIVLDATVQRSFYGYYIRDTFVSVGLKGASYKLHNPSAYDQVLYGTVWENNCAGSYIDIQNCGDSVVLRMQTVQGQQHNKPSIVISNIPGAAQCQIDQCNLTNGAGMVYAKNCEQLRIANNQIEKQPHAWTGTDAARRGCVVLEDSSHCVVENNNITASSGAANGCHGLIELNSNGAETTSRRNRYVNNPVIGVDTANGWHHLVYEGCLATYEGNNSFHAGTFIEGAPSIFRSNYEMPIYGIWESMFQSSGWVNGTVSGYFAGAYYKATENGKIALRGAIKSGSTTPGDLLGALPSQFFLPGAANTKALVTVVVDNGGTLQPGYLELGDGATTPHGLYVKSLASNTHLFLDGASLDVGTKEAA